MSMNTHELTEQIKRKGLELGFSKVGVTSADDFIEYEQELLSRPDYQPFWGLGTRPRDFYPAAQSIVCATYSFADIQFPKELEEHVGRIYLSRSYSPLADSLCGLRVNGFTDYLKSLGCDVYQGDIDIPCRMACARAGLVTYGKNNFAYTKEDGSFIALYAFVIDTPLEYDQATVTCNCPPNCTACIDACPTQAILAPGRLHPQHCLLFNHMSAGPIPETLAEHFGTYIHGCDICQKACPRNKKVLEKANRKDLFLEELASAFDLEKVLLMDETYYQNIVHPIMYNYIQDIDLFRRNAAIALGNTNDPIHLSALKKARSNPNVLVREAVEWAITKLTDR